MEKIMNFKLILFHILSLTTGSAIYIFFRTDSLRLFRWFDNLMLSKSIVEIREITLPYKEIFPKWILYSLPDGLWIFSYECLVLFIWGKDINRNNSFWLLFIPFIALFSEAGQVLNFVPGTFDLIDILFYSIGFLLPIVFFTNKINFFNYD